MSGRQSVSGRSAVNARRGVQRMLALGATGLTAAVLLVSVGTAGPASAHVTASIDDPTPGAYTLLTFNAPTESATASTNRLEIDFPTDTPITSVRSVPVPGWNTEVIREPLPEPVDNGHGGEISEAVARVVWTSVGDTSAVGPGQTGLFILSIGPLPDAESVSFPTVQGYTDGSEVAWTQLSQAGVDTERPAPTIQIGTDTDTGAGSGSGAGAGADEAAGDDEEPAGLTGTLASGAGAGAAADAEGLLASPWIAVGGAALGAVGFVLGLLAFLTARRSARAR